MATQACNSTHSGACKVSNAQTEEHFCYNCRRKVSDLEPFSKFHAAVRKLIITFFGKSMYMKLFSQNRMANHTLGKTWRSGGTYCWGSSWECQDCVGLPDPIATLQSNDAYLCELVNKVCDYAGYDHMLQMINDLQSLTLDQLENMNKKTVGLVAWKSGLDPDLYQTIAWAITRKMITPQKNGPQPVFIINDTPFNACCSICAKTPDELRPFDQEFVLTCHQEERKIGGDVEATHCVCRYIDPADRLAKRTRMFDEDHGADITWECADCYKLSNEQALQRLNSRKRQ